MCDFCEKREEINTGTGHWYILKVGELHGMYYRHGECQNSCGVEISHCPMCGRKLGEETEKRGIKDKIFEEIRKTQPNFLDFSEFYKKYGCLIPGIGDIWHWYEDLTDEAKKEGFAQITDMSAEEFFEFYVKIRDDWEKWHKTRLDKKAESENLSTEELLEKLRLKMTEEDYEALQDGVKSFSDGINALWSVRKI